MPWQREDEVRVQCYPSGGSLLLRIAGYVLIAAGVLVILLCVPGSQWKVLPSAGTQQGRGSKAPPTRCPGPAEPAATLCHRRQDLVSARL